jgi:hypothetical protein
MSAEYVNGCIYTKAPSGDKTKKMDSVAVREKYMPVSFKENYIFDGYFNATIEEKGKNIFITYTLDENSKISECAGVLKRIDPDFTEKTQIIPNEVTIEFTINQNGYVDKFDKTLNIDYINAGTNQKRSAYVKTETKYLSPGSFISVDLPDLSVFKEL